MSIILDIPNLQVWVFRGKLYIHEEYGTLAEVKKRELSVKGMKSRKYIEELIAKGMRFRF